MIIKSIQLSNFRNYEKLDISFDSETNIIYGDNAQGKTNILEAAYLSGTTKSHKGSKDKEMIRFDDDKVEVQMSPLIDCVFLLLIFFLVTTMMKKWEMQIPLTLPTMTSSLSTTRAGEEAVIIAVDEKKNVYQVVGHDAY